MYFSRLWIFSSVRDTSLCNLSRCPCHQHQNRPCQHPTHSRVCQCPLDLPFVLNHLFKVIPPVLLICEKHTALLTANIPFPQLEYALLVMEEPSRLQVSTQPWWCLTSSPLRGLAFLVPTPCELSLTSRPYRLCHSSCIDEAIIVVIRLIDLISIEHKPHKTGYSRCHRCRHRHHPDHWSSLPHCPLLPPPRHLQTGREQVYHIRQYVATVLSITCPKSISSLSAQAVLSCSIPGKSNAVIITSTFHTSTSTPYPCLIFCCAKSACMSCFLNSRRILETVLLGSSDIGSQTCGVTALALPTVLVWSVKVMSSDGEKP